MNDERREMDDQRMNGFWFYRWCHASLQIASYSKSCSVRELGKTTVAVNDFTLMDLSVAFLPLSGPLTIITSDPMDFCLCKR